ncbi:asparagine synthase-related protein [Geodermatophilus sp. SYSU D01036]
MAGQIVRPGELRHVARLSGDELAWGWPHGLDPTVTAVGSRRAEGGHPRQVLERLVRDALTAGPVFVSFSGGRDSSALLAVATHVARREGLPLPVPLTSRFRGDPEADETSWQELVVRHLALTDWVVVDASGTSDAVGEWSTAVLDAVGRNVFPPGATRSGVRAVHARGGTLIGGEPGDWVLGTHRMTYVRHLLRRRGRVGRRGWTAVAEALAPAPVRGALAARRTGSLPWLLPEAARRHRRAAARDAWDDPLSWDRAVRSLLRRRFATLGLPTVAAVVRAHGAEPLEPFGTQAFVDAFAAWGGRSGRPGRTDVMHLLFGDLLPAEVLGRQSKAGFNRQVFGAATRAFAESWTGAGVDHGVVDAERLREEWLADRPDGRSLGLLQEAWLAASATRRGGAV